MRQTLSIHCELQAPWPLKINTKTEFTMTALCGRVGSGKSTLLHSIAKNPACASINNQQLHSNDIVLINQQPRLIPHWSIDQHFLYFDWQKGNIRFDQWLSRKKHLNPLKKSMIDQLNIYTLFNHKPDQLSGGQKKLIACVLGLYRAPKLLLLDEPFANLGTREQNLLSQCMLNYYQQSQNFLIITGHQVEVFKQVCQAHWQLDQQQILQPAKRWNCVSSIAKGHHANAMLWHTE